MKSEVRKYRETFKCMSGKSIVNEGVEIAELMDKHLYCVLGKKQAGVFEMYIDDKCFPIRLHPRNIK